VLQDRYGNSLTTSSTAARDAYVVGVDRLLSADAKIDDAFRKAIVADDGFALAHIALARTHQLLGRGAEVKAHLARALALAAGTDEREQSHIGIFAKIVTGQGAAAVPLVLEHTKKWPRDAVVLSPITGVFGLIGFSGKSGREVEQLAVLQPLASAYGDDWWFRTVLAFAEIEFQDFKNGHRNIEAALRGNPRNAHAAHVRSHLHYELGERGEGLNFLKDWVEDYPKEGQLHCHISWHQAIWSLETGRREDAWRIYTNNLQPGGSWGPQLNVLTDCASFLARAEMAGETINPDLWRTISRYASQWFPDSGITFADIHSALAFAMAGEGDALRRLIDNPKGSAADILAPIARGFDAFARQEWSESVRELQPVLATHERLGGSRAQRDLLEYTVTSALFRNGQSDEARHLISTRRPGNGRGGFPIAGLVG
jgi:hypothetical protein